MTEREALIRAVCAEPWDDTRRLAGLPREYEPPTIPGEECP